MQTMNAFVPADQNATIRELANDAGLASSTVLNILKADRNQCESYADHCL